HFRMELAVEDSVAEVGDGNPAVLPDGVLLTDVVQDDEAFDARDRLVRFAGDVIILPDPVLHFIERLMAGVQHLLHPRRHLTAVAGQPFLLGLYFGKGLPYAQGVPHFERSQFPTETGPHGNVNTAKLVAAS